MAGIGAAPCRAVTAEDIRDLERWTGQTRPLYAGGFTVGTRCSSGLVISPSDLSATRV
ncbi:MAG: hypothetical protein QOD26_2183 [Betaproteobacteria bacterium]|jgi:hypothetical protein|nr:hypothetical protein [Chloroflexota bacterium]MEA3193850.1 hypothetical protein [Betaproteobacteria bacterium]